MKTILTLAILSATIGLSSIANALTIDADEYFAFRKAPQMGLIILLSHKPCQWKGWERVKFIHTLQGYSTFGCWKQFDDAPEIVNLCSVVKGTDKNGGCLPASKAGFIDTSTLPTGARF